VNAALTGGGSIVATDNEERTGLSFACARDDWEVALSIVKLLLANDLSPQDRTNTNGMLFTLLLDFLPQKLWLFFWKDVNIHSLKQQSALLLCCIRCDEEAVDVALVLLDAGADIESVEAQNSRTPLLVACLNSRPELVSLLLERGANMNSVDSSGRSALHWACRNGAFGREMIPLLVNAGVDVLHKNNNGDDAIFIAS
jgi:hypothetical protein